ncbi:hypothetical protein [Ruminococcus albus]|uniref:Uncharacterized protein n=1 Tax=Ruminococcus albus TaxID=1264 RepID=A0A1H7PYR4_RUMAL|nr:hypothetical protein [Ruminococcus albus]SEL40405.1 hypothetical protein SAMN05216469_12618 [Ruminococcus albus]
MSRKIGAERAWKKVLAELAVLMPELKEVKTAEEFLAAVGVSPPETGETAENGGGADE